MLPEVPPEGDAVGQEPMVEMSIEDSRKYAAYFIREINQAQHDRQKWYTRARKIIQRYRDERDASGSADRSTLGMGTESRSLNLFYSNTETLKPAIYSKRPQPVVERRFLDKDPVGRAASSILERSLRYEIQSCGFHDTLMETRDEYLLAGQGLPWVRYCPQFSESVSVATKADIEPDGDEGQDIDEGAEDAAQIINEKSWESLEVDFVSYDDFLPLGRPSIWKQCQAATKRVRMTREDMKRKPEFAETWERIPLNSNTQTDKNKANTPEARSSEEIGETAEIFEVWNKADRTVYWVCKDFDELCGHVPDPMRLEGFFPFPRPILANKTNNTLVPVPDYIQAQDQYLQINDLTRRIDILTNACRVIGFYDASERNITRAFTEGREPQLIPVDQWAMFAERGGSKGMIDFVPIEIFAKTIRELIVTRQQLVADLDRVTGVWDILRGETNPNETLGAQQLKQQNGVGRLQERQEEFSRLCRDTIEIMGEIQAEHYSPETLIQISGAMFDESLQPQNQAENQNPMMGHNGGPQMNPQGAQPALPAGMGQPGAAPQPNTPQVPPAAPMPLTPEQKKAEEEKKKLLFIMEAITLLRSDKSRGFRIDVETDSTIQPDANQEKMARTEFLKASMEFMTGAVQIGAMNPQVIPLLGKMYQFGASGFRVSRDLESAIDEYTDQMTMAAKAQAAAPPQPSPEEIKAQSEMARTQADLKGKEMEMVSREKEMAHEDRMKAMDEKLKMLDVAIALAAAGQDETGEDGTVTRKANPELKQMVEAITSQNELLAKVEKGLRQRNAPKRVERDEKGRPVRVVAEEIVDEPQAMPNDRMGELLSQVAGQMGEAPAPMNITRNGGNIGLSNG